MRIIRLIFTKYKFILIVIIVSVFAVSDLAHYGIPPTHDGEYHVLRFWQFYKVISEGIYYPRWVPDFNNGFGIPLFTYVYPLPNFVAAFFHFLGFSFIASFKLDMALFTIMGSIFFYLWAKKYWGEAGGAVSSVFYTFSPYHFVDIYVRGSVGEVMALGIFPILLWSYAIFLESKKIRFLILSSVSLALLIYSHNILALLFFCFFVFYAAFLIINSLTKLQDFLALILIIFTGLGLGAPFWVPALLETKYVQGLQVFNISYGFPELYQLIFPSWGFGLSPNDLTNPMSVQIGVTNLLVVMISIILLLKHKAKKIMTFFIAWFFLVFFLITPYSSWFWQHVPLFSYFQFSWRLLSLEILICSFLAGSLVRDELFKNKYIIQSRISVLLILLAVALSASYAKAHFYQKRDDSHYLSRSNFTDGTNSPGNAFNTKWLSAIPAKTKDKFQIISGEDQILKKKVNAELYELVVTSKVRSKLLINTAYFPNWTARVNNRTVPIINQAGKMAITVPNGISKVSIGFGSTLVEKLSYICFAASAIMLGLFAGKTIDIIKK